MHTQHRSKTKDMKKSKDLTCLLLVLISITSTTASNSLVYSASVGNKLGTTSNQVTVIVRYNVSLGVAPPGHPTLTTYNRNGTVLNQLTLQESPQTLTVDVGSTWSVSKLLPGFTENERWAVKDSSGLVTEGTTTLNFTYYHQFAQVVSFSTLYGQTKPSTVGPNFTSTMFGDVNGTRTAIDMEPQTVWADFNSTWYIAHSILGSIAAERWLISNVTQGRVTQSGRLTFFYAHQYLLNMQVKPGGAGLTQPATQWVNAGEIVRIEAKPNSGYNFTNWSCSATLGIECYSGYANPSQVTMNGPLNETANFQQPITVIIQTDAGMQSVIIDGKSSTITTTPTTLDWSPNSTHTLTALSDMKCGFSIGPLSFCQWRFVRWIFDGNTETNSTLQLRADRPYRIEASWKKDYTNLYIVLILVVALAGVALLLRRHRGGPPAPPRVEPSVRASGIQYRVGYLTDVGNVRTNNEDSLLAIEVLRAFESKPTSTVLCAVADGVGGSQKGEVASRLTLQTLAVRASEHIIRGEDKGLSESLRTCIENSNDAVVKYGMGHRESEGLATTIVATFIEGRSAYVAHVGDSRAYLVNRGEIRQLTKDHSEVQELMDAGKVPPDQARHYPGRNIITRAVGASTDIQVAVSTVTLAPGDRILLCSDGLWEPVTDAEIHSIVMQSSDPQYACAKLVTLAKDRGGKDNITVVIVELQGPGEMTK